MEAREAIEVLTDKNTSIGTLKCDDTAWRKLKPAIDAAVEALKKQIPKKIVHKPEAGREADWTCVEIDTLWNVKLRQGYLCRPPVW